MPLNSNKQYIVTAAMSSRRIDLSTDVMVPINARHCTSLTEGKLSQYLGTATISPTTHFTKRILHCSHTALQTGIHKSQAARASHDHHHCSLSLAFVWHPAVTLRIGVSAFNQSNRQERNGQTDTFKMTQGLMIVLNTRDALDCNVRFTPLACPFYRHKINTTEYLRVQWSRIMLMASLSLWTWKSYYGYRIDFFKKITKIEKVQDNLPTLFWRS